MTVSKVFKNGKTQWRVAFEAGGKTKRKFFHSKREADEFASTIHRHQGQIAEGILSMSPGRQALLLEAYDKAEANGINLLVAVDYYLNERGGISSEDLGIAIERFLKTKANLAYTSRQSLNVVKAFSARYGHLPLSKVDRDVCHEFLFADEALAPSTVRGYKVRLGTFFNWCMDEGLLARNPVQKIKVASAKRGAITFLNAKQCRHLLITAKHNDPGMVPLLAIGMFAGVRMGEMRGQVDKPGLTWDEVYLDRPEPEMEIKENVGKTGRRMVPISENLKVWLGRGGDLFPIKNHRKRLDKIRELADLGEMGQWEWDSSILRHTFASMHVAHHKNPDHTRYLMGHEEKSQTFRRHYDGRVSPLEAREFWDILP